MAKKIKADTLLRKIQRGKGSDIGVGSGNAPSLNINSGKIQMFKRREIVQPYLHPIDADLVNDSVSRAVRSQLKNLDPEIEKNYDKLLPRHLVNDLYSLYYNPSGSMKFEGLDKSNKVKFDILDSINNSLIKIVTNNSHIGSYVYTEEIGKFLYKKFMTLPPEQREQLSKAMDQCNQPGGGQGQQPNKPQPGGGSQGKGKNDPNNQPPGKGRPDEDQDHGGRQDSDPNAQAENNADNTARGGANNSHGNNSQKDMSQDAADKIANDLEKAVENMSNMLNSKQSQKELEQAFKDAEQKLDKLKDIGVDIEDDDQLPEDEKKEIIKNLNNLDNIRYSLQRLNTSKDKVLKAVDKILNGTSNYFSPRCVTKDVEIFEADQLLDINGLELLHPIFRNSRLLDLSVTERKYIGKFDLYVDCSGSMSSGCGGDLGGIMRIDLAKSLAMQMRELGILGDLYEFEDRPKKIMNSDISILMMAARGGTNIENVMQNILKTGNNSVILSDGESYVSTYSHKALFIGIGTDFHYFKYDRGTGSKFVEENQCIYYDGKNFVEAVPDKR